MSKLKSETVYMLRESTTVAEARQAASGYYSGQGDPLYMLMSGNYEEWDESDLESVCVAVDRMVKDIQDRMDEEWYDSSFLFSSAFESILELERG